MFDGFTLDFLGSPEATLRVGAAATDSVSGVTGERGLDLVEELPAM